MLTKKLYSVAQKKVHHYKESSLNRIKNSSVWLHFPSLLSIKWAQKCYKFTLNFLLFYVWPNLWLISCCVWSCEIGKINAYDKIMIENPRKKENMEIKEICYINVHLIDGLGMEF